MTEGEKIVYRKALGRELTDLELKEIKDINIKKNKENILKNAHTILESSKDLKNEDKLQCEKIQEINFVRPAYGEAVPIEAFTIEELKLIISIDKSNRYSPFHFC